MILLDYIEELQTNGKLWFTKTEAKQVLGCTELAITKAIERLTKKKKLVPLKSGFILIVPVAYKSWGITPPDWFIDPLMNHLQISYYVGLLTAASFYGAAHQKPQIFQVMLASRLEGFVRKRVGVKFYNNKDLSLIPKKNIQVHTGYMQISSPEATALDIVKYYRVCGYLSNVATVLSELHEIMDPDKLLTLINSNIYDIANLQRLGYLLSLPEVGGAYIVNELKTLIQKNKPRFVPLQPGQKINKVLKDHTWRIFVNEEIEVDI